MIAEEVVKNGSLNVEIKYGVLTFLNQTWSLCEFAETQQRQCPLKTGPFEVHFHTTVPKSLLKVRPGESGISLLCLVVAAVSAGSLQWACSGCGPGWQGTAVCSGGYPDMTTLTSHCPQQSCPSF